MKETAIFAGGCFWCLDAIFRHLKGVSSSTCGYAGGTAEDADYYRVASKRTGHAESVQVVFDETVLPPETLLDIFFLIHDPTTLNRLYGRSKGKKLRQEQTSLLDNLLPQISVQGRPSGASAVGCSRFRPWTTPARQKQPP